VFSTTLLWFCQWVAPLLSRLISARGKALARIKAAKSPLAAAAAHARKVLSIVRCKRGNVHDIKMNVYLHDYERGAAK